LKEATRESTAFPQTDPPNRSNITEKYGKV